MNSENDPLSHLQILLEKTYKLVEYARLKFDSAPIALGHYSGNVGDDRQFLGEVEQLKTNIKTLVESNWGNIEYQRFLTKLDHIKYSVPPGMVPARKGFLRARGWWDARDELQEIANYLHDLASDLEEKKVQQNVAEYSSEQSSKRSPWLSGSFYLAAFVIVVILLIIVFDRVGLIGLPFVIIGALLLVSVLGALQLRQDKSLSEESFLKLMLAVYKQLPLLLRQNGK